MPLSNATIESRGNGHGTITLDGADVSHLVGKVEFTSQPGKVDTLILHTHIAAKIEAKGVKVALDEQTRNWLAALGWTPPVEGECPTTPHDCGDGHEGPHACNYGILSLPDYESTGATPDADGPIIPVASQSRIENPVGFHQPTLREALEAYLESLPQRYSPVVRGIRALMSYYPND
ncbi:hypothetical protein SALGADO_38 [Arthrobacter phage Salgado]|uniref:Uncharacterized protein n=1 Tax=Arthrobacter phage Salgado TaxID=1772314 RepID=A0A0U4B664_9CAUD|nr:hypothetical protein KMD22_gp38 [Arthrobacter phage Salgado]ALY10206.1 hypothetical protein SALGADO_38 [Arthrobacter phage Salgado]